VLPDNGGVAGKLIAVLILIGGGINPLGVAAAVTPLESLQFSYEERSLVDFAFARFHAQGLTLPRVKFTFHSSLAACHQHKGLYRARTRSLEMCSLDKSTMLHELAHAWVNDNLTLAEMEAFVAWRELDSWSDSEDPWHRRGTEHVAETIAWALLDEPRHVKWVETDPDGTKATTYRILTLGIDVTTMAENFQAITGREPLIGRLNPERVAGETSSNSPEGGRHRGGWPPQSVVAVNSSS
jgi:hypothetical protein